MLQEIIAHCPPVVTSRLRTRHGEEILVARDDLLPGGTKERALREYLLQMNREGFIYASPFSGFAQIALAQVCRELNFSCTIIAEKDPRTGSFHPYTLRAGDAGARIFLAETLIDAEELAVKVSGRFKNMLKLPLGFNAPEFRQSMTRVLESEWKNISDNIHGGVRRLWIPVGSGTLANAFLQFLPMNIKINALNVHVLSQSDQRIKVLRESARIRLYDADRPFHSPATDLPEIPSNHYYDAKLWSIVDAEGRTGDLWWNVAG